MRFREFVAVNFRSERLKHHIMELGNLLADLCWMPQPRQAAVAAMRTEARLPAAHASTEQLWLDAGSPLHAWLKQNGVRVTPGTLPPYAQGGSGRAYFLGDKVVKITANPVEANVAAMVAGRQGLPVAVIAVTPLGGGLYAILQHFVNMQNIPEKIKRAADFLTAVVDENPGMTGFPENEVERRHLCIDAIHRHGGSADMLPWMLMIMEALHDLYRATGFQHNDAGPSNIGFQKGKVIIPDLGPNQTGDFDPNQALQSIQMNRQSLNLPPHNPI